MLLLSVDAASVLPTPPHQPSTRYECVCHVWAPDIPPLSDIYDCNAIVSATQLTVDILFVVYQVCSVACY